MHFSPRGLSVKEGEVVNGLDSEDTHVAIGFVFVQRKEMNNLLLCVRFDATQQTVANSRPVMAWCKTAASSEKSGRRRCKRQMAEVHDVLRFI